MIRNNPDKSEFSNLLNCVLCIGLSILKPHVLSKKVTRECTRVNVRFIVKCIAKLNILLVSLLLLLFGILLGMAQQA